MQPARPLVVALAAALSLAAARQARTPEPTLSAVLARAGSYVDDFQRKLAGFVAEEDYVQRVEYADEPIFVRRGTVPKLRRRELRSDLLLVRVAGADAYVQFRDVFEVDGQPVRDRIERLTALFAEPSGSWVEQARRLAAASARYNIGGIDRNINVPLLAIAALDPRNQSRFRFKRAKSPTGEPHRSGAARDLPDSPRYAVSTEVWIIQYDETEPGTIIRDPGHRDLPMHGRVWIEPGSGRVLLGEVVAEDSRVRARIQVSYQSEPLLGFLVPIEMREDYQGRVDHSRIFGTATYGNFRPLGTAAR